MMLKRGPSKKGELNMTPMIDIVFQLLIFFLVATQIKQDEMNVPLRLPKSTQAIIDLLKDKNPAPLTINIIPKSASEVPYRIMGLDVTHEDLARILQAQAKRQHDLGGELADVRIRADRKSTLEQLQSVLKACQSEKILHVYIAAERGTDQGSNGTKPGAMP